MADDLLCDGPVTKTFLAQKLKEFFKTKANVTSIEGKVISKGLGFTSDVIKVHLKWDPCDGLPQSLIVKAPKIQSIETLMESLGVTEMAMSAQFVPMIHACECRAYDLLSQHDVVPLPKIYGFCLVEAHTPGLIVMEDLADKAGIKDNIADGVTLEQWRNVMEALADLHGWSLITDIPWQKDFPGIEMLMGMMGQMIGAAPESLKKVKAKFPDYLGDVDADRIVQLMDIKMFEKKIAESREVVPDMLTHGDTWVNNIFFSKNSDGTLSDKVEAIIDWQVSLKSNGFNDLSRFTSWCVNHDMRRKHGEEMFRHYFDRLKAKAGDKFPTTYEQAKIVFDDMNTINGIFGVVAADMFLTMIAKVDEDKTGKRRKEMLERVRAGYDDGVKYMDSPEGQKSFGAWGCTTR